MTSTHSANQADSARPDFVERRREPRLRSLLTGMIVFGENHSTMDCTVRNISAWGARVVVADTFRLPLEFDLRIPHHDKTHRARIIWRKGDHAGLALADVQPVHHREHVRLTARESARLRRKELDHTLF